MNEPYTDKELRRFRRDDHRSPTILRFLATTARLQERAEEAEAAVEKEGIVIYNGLSVPKRVLDEVQAEHAGRIADLVAERDALQARAEEAEEHMGEAWQEYRRLRYLRRRLRWAEEESDRYKALEERRKKALSNAARLLDYISRRTDDGWAGMGERKHYQRLLASINDQAGEGAIRVRAAIEEGK